MKLGELVGKDIINIHSGTRLGTVGDTDLLIDNETGHISSIIIPNRGNIFTLWGNKEHLIIPWEAVVKIGNEVILVELDENPTINKNK
ncbi:MAG: Sporulation protein, YlmC/YmxH family [Clostridia bacterium 41_269]|nr:MAG: Sporulation protein, YlmC/YmxH family [Clostridia bacterium 41_269]